MLFSAIGAGTVVGALSWLRWAILPQGRLALGSMLLWAVALAVFGWSGSLRVAVPALFVWERRRISRGPHDDACCRRVFRRRCEGAP